MAEARRQDSLDLFLERVTGTGDAIADDGYVSKGACCGAILGTVLSVQLVLAVVAFSLAVLVQSNLREIDGTIVSPFEDIVTEYYPKSTKSCYYPTFTHNITSTFACDFNTTYAHYCPVGYSCSHIHSDNAPPYGCLSIELSCDDIETCANSVYSLPLFENSLSSRIINTSAALTPVVLDGVFLPVLAIICIISVILACMDRFSDYWKFIAGVGYLSLFASMLLYIISSVEFFVTSSEPFHNTGLLGNCYNHNINTKLLDAAEAGTAYFELFIYIVIFYSAFSLLFFLSLALLIFLANKWEKY